MKSITPQAGKKVLQYSKRAFGLFTSTLLLFTSFIILNQNAEAQPLICPPRALEQVTDETTGDSSRPALNADGTLVVFTSSADINGGNPDGNFEIYLFDWATGIYTQLTDETAGDSLEPAINADGTRIAFESAANINGGKPEGNSETYLVDTTTGIIAQITDEPAGDSLLPSINADGTRIAIQSAANINGGNPEGNRKIYLFNTTTGIFTQITDETIADSFDPIIDAVGTLIVFHSRLNLNGGNPEGNREVYLYDTTTGITTQITFTTVGENLHATISADGTRIAFHSDADLTGGNPDMNIEVFLFDIPTGMFTQITDETVGVSADASINGDGTHIVFESNADINGGNPEGNFEIYYFDTETGMFTQITDETTGDSFLPAINPDGTRIAFESNADINGWNPEGNLEVYLTACIDPNAPSSVPTLSQWAL